MLWLGILLAVLASMSGTAGKQCLRCSQLQSEKGTQPAALLSRAFLCLGLFLNVLLGPLLDMGSYAFAPQSVIAPLGGLDVVWNTLSAPCTLQERLTAPLAAGCLLIALGATGCSLFGAREDDDGVFDFAGLQETLVRWDVLFYLLALGLWVMLNVALLRVPHLGPGGLWRGLLLGMTAGSIAGNMFCVKALVEVLQASIEALDGSYWQHWLPWALLLGAVFFATTNLFFLTRAMREYDALFMGAVFEGTLIVAGCVSGIVVFRELKSLKPWQIGLYCAAVACIVLGIFVVAYGCMAAPGPEDDVSTVDTDTVGAEVPSIIDTELTSLPKVSLRRSFESTSPLSVRSVTWSGTMGPFRDVPVLVTEIRKARLSARQTMVVPTPGSLEPPWPRGPPEPPAAVPPAWPEMPCCVPDDDPPSLT